MAVIVIDRVMLGTTIVPESDGANAPTEAAGKFRANLMAEEVVEYRRAFCGSHTVEGYSVGNVDIERPASGFGVNAHDRIRWYSRTRSSLALEAFLYHRRVATTEADSFL